MIPRDRIVEAARDALARVRPEPSGLSKWIREHVVDPLAEAMTRVFSAVAGSVGPWVLTAFLVAVVLGAVGLIAWLALWLVRRDEARRRLDAGTQAAAARKGAVDPAAAEAEAARLAAAGEFAPALRLLYLASVVRLHERAGHPFDPSLTPGEHLRGFRRAPWFPRLLEFVRAYERVSFGGQALDAEGYRAAGELRPAEAAA